MRIMSMRPMRKLIPLFDRVLILKAEQISKTDSGVIIPEKGQTKVVRGTVVATGPGSRNPQGQYIPLGLKVGDSVLLPSYGGTKVDLEDDKKYQIFKETEILAKIE